MFGMPVGAATLIAISILIYLGLAHRVLDRMRLTDRQALWVLGLMAIGSFINLPLGFRNLRMEINLGGAIIPVGVAVFLVATAGSRWEAARALVATAGTSVGLWVLNRYVLLPDPWHGAIAGIDPVLADPIIAGVVAFLLGRSRRAAFVAATIGVLLLDIFNLGWLLRSGLPGVVAIGGAGAFDAIVIAGVISVLLAETAGELRERLQRGNWARYERLPLNVPSKKPTTSTHNNPSLNSKPIRRG
ncbi:MAG: DUF1614 domain-containing protein [Clostridia bacterium]|nr:DUF1614 domain-containing protein [Clostridia bacterium]